MTNSSAPDSHLPSRIVIVAGTYDGVLAGWDTVDHDQEKDRNDIDTKLLRRNNGSLLKLSFAMASHEGSVRCLDLCSSFSVDDELRKRQRKNKEETSASPLIEPGTLLSGGFDETINVFNLQKHAQAGELKAPHDLGTPLCCSFAPPLSSMIASQATHALVGLTSGKIILYKKRDWSIQHILAGHDEGGVQCLAVHPTGRMALSGGRDGKIVLWDLMKGRLAFVYKLSSTAITKRRKETVNHIVWSGDGNRYAFCYGTKVTSRDVASGEDLLDVNLPSRVNQLAFIGGPEGVFLAGACDDGGLPVMQVGQLQEEKNDAIRRAIMAIEPVDDVVAGDDRLKCIRSVEGGSGFLVVTANSGGVISLIDLEGAVRMMLTGENEEQSEIKEENDSESEGSSSDSAEEIERAAEIIDSVRVGSGARVTSLTAWSCVRGELSEKTLLNIDSEPDSMEDPASEDQDPLSKNTDKLKYRKIELDAEAVEKARKLVSQAKKRQKRQKQRLQTKNATKI